MDGDATAAINVFTEGDIQNGRITFGDGAGDCVQSSSAAVVGASATAAGGDATDTVKVTLIAGRIADNVIKFGDGAGDFVAVGPSNASITDTVNATGNATSSVRSSDRAFR